MELIVYAPVWGQSGYEHLSRQLLMAMDQVGVQIELRQALEWNAERVGLPQDTIDRLTRMTRQKVSLLAPHVFYQIPRISQPVHPDAPLLCYTLFETDRCPRPWMDGLMKMDKILVFSEFNHRGWIDSGIPEAKITNLPVAVDSFLYNPDGPRMEIPNRKGFSFLMSGDFTERKNFEAVVEAYVTEFTDREEVTLIVKAHYGGFTKPYRRECMKKLREIAHRFNPRNPPRILFWGDKLSNQAMASLYRSCDCFVLASRGEGLGMQYLEAMASGLPVIHCNWSAHTDYLDPYNSYPVKYVLKIIDDPNYIVKCPQALNAKWAQVDLPELRSAMRHVFEHPQKAMEKAARALRWVRQQTWANMGLAFMREVINLYSSTAPKVREEVAVA